MNIRKVIKRRIRHRAHGVDLAGDVNAVIAANVGREGETTSASSRQRIAGHRSSARAAAHGGGEREQEQGEAEEKD